VTGKNLLTPRRRSATPVVDPFPRRLPPWLCQCIGGHQQRLAATQAGWAWLGCPTYASPCVYLWGATSSCRGSVSLTFRSDLCLRKWVKGRSGGGRGWGCQLAAKIGQGALPQQHAESTPSLAHWFPTLQLAKKKEPPKWCDE